LRFPEEIYETYKSQVRGFLYRLCQNEMLADELTQETFFQALEGWNQYRGQGAILTWLCGIAKHLYYHTMRKPDTIPYDDNIEDPTDFVDKLVRHDQALSIHRVLHSLDEPYHEVFMLRTFCEMSHKEIGNLFSKSESWSRVTYYRARQILFDALKKEDIDER